MPTAGRPRVTIPLALLVAFLNVTRPAAAFEWSTFDPSAAAQGAPSPVSDDTQQPSSDDAAQPAAGSNPPAQAPDQPPATAQTTPAPPASGQDAQPSSGQKGDRIFGMIPNNATVEGATQIAPIPASEKFKLGAENAFDPFVYVFVGITAGVAQAQGSERSFGYGPAAFAKRYAVAFTDNTINGMMTTSIFPSMLKQDPRYFQLGQGTTPHRMGYAASRILVGRSDAGHKQFNLSEIGGNVVAAGISEAYYPPENRTALDVAERWALNVMWDTLSNELKEFWPDIRRKMHKQ